jgi:hypothetical protein
LRATRFESETGHDNAGQNQQSLRNQPMTSNWMTEMNEDPVSIFSNPLHRQIVAGVRPLAS